MPSPAPPSLTLPPAAGEGRRSATFLLVLALAHAGGVIAYLPLLTLLLPVKVEAVAGPARIGVFTATVIAGALAASLSNIACGALSDRAVARGRGRRGGLAAGALAMALSYIGLALAASPAAIVAAVIAFQVAVNALIAPLFAIMADEVPDTQKGLSGGLLSLANPVASAVSAALVGLPVLGEGGCLALVVAASLSCVLPLLLTRAAPPVADPPSPAALRRRDLLVAWAARLLVQVAGNVLALYLLYYAESLTPGEPAPVVAVRVGQLLLAGYVAPLPIAVLLGRLSDRSGRRKPFLFAAAAAAALGLVAMAMARDWSAGALGFGLYATGSSVFLALHAAFAMQLLPSARHRGHDLGLLNLANTLPALVGPLLAWALASPHDFGALMLVLAALTLAGGTAILGVRGRR